LYYLSECYSGTQKPNNNLHLNAFSNVAAHTVTDPWSPDTHKTAWLVLQAADVSPALYSTEWGRSPSLQYSTSPPTYFKKHPVTLTTHIWDRSLNPAQGMDVFSHFLHSPLMARPCNKLTSKVSP
jgi:hypothetical protein